MSMIKEKDELVEFFKSNRTKRSLLRSYIKQHLNVMVAKIKMCLKESE